MIRANRALIAILVLLAGIGADAAQIEVTALDGTRIRGEVLTLVPQLTLKNADGETELAWSEVLAIEPLHGSEPEEQNAEATPFRFSLIDGSRFGASIKSAAGREVSVRVLGDQPARISLSQIRSIVSSSASVAVLDRVRDAAKIEQQDVAILPRGDTAVTLRGTLLRVESERVVFRWNKRELPLPWSKLGALIMANPPHADASATVRLISGDVFAGRVHDGNERTLTLRSPVFSDLIVAWERIERIDCRSRRMVYLSDIEPAMYEFEPFFKKQWHFARDKSLRGLPIRLGGRDYQKGISVKSRSVLVYELDGTYKQFAATVGILDEMKKRGDVEMIVMGDERVLWKSEHVRGGQPPVDVLVDLSGVRGLALIVDYGADLDLSDHACWAGARLIR